MGSSKRGGFATFIYGATFKGRMGSVSYRTGRTQGLDSRQVVFLGLTVRILLCQFKYLWMHPRYTRNFLNNSPHTLTCIFPRRHAFPSLSLFFSGIRVIIKLRLPLRVEQKRVSYSYCLKTDPVLSVTCTSCQRRGISFERFPRFWLTVGADSFFQICGARGT